MNSLFIELFTTRNLALDRWDRPVLCNSIIWLVRHQNVFENFTFLLTTRVLDETIWTMFEIKKIDADFPSQWLQEMQREWKLTSRLTLFSQNARSNSRFVQSRFESTSHELIVDVENRISTMQTLFKSMKICHRHRDWLIKTFSQNRFGPKLGRCQDFRHRKQKIRWSDDMN